MPFNHYSWLMAHNAFARMGHKSDTGSVLLAPINQQDSITAQLEVCFSSLCVCCKLALFS